MWIGQVFPALEATEQPGDPGSKARSLSASRRQSWRDYTLICFGQVNQMRKSTTQKIAALTIVLIFGMSSIAFFFSGFFPQANQQNDLKPLSSFIVEGEVDQRLEDAYYKGGFTWMKFYYADANDPLHAVVDQLPELFQAPGRQTQLVVQKLQGNETYIYLYSVNGQEELSDPTEDSIINALCNILTVPPPDCAFLNQTSSGANEINSNSTANNTV